MILFSETELGKCTKSFEIVSLKDVCILQFYLKKKKKSINKIIAELSRFMFRINHAELWK